MSLSGVERQTYSVAELAEILGVGATTIHRHVRDGSFPIPCHQIGKKLRFSKELVRRYLACEPLPSQEDVAS